MPTRRFPSLLVLLAALLFPAALALAGESPPARPPAPQAPPAAGGKAAPGSPAADPAALLLRAKEAYRRGQDALEGRGPEAEGEPSLRKAAAAFEEIIRDHAGTPAAPEAALFLGTTRLLLDEVEPALTAYRVSYETGAGFRDRGLALYRMGICQASLDRPAEARATFERFLREFPDRRSDAPRVARSIQEISIVGKKAPPFRPPAWTNGIAGEEGLEAFLGQPVVLVYLATWCPNCRRELPHLRKLMKKWSSSDAVFIGVLDPDDPKKTSTVEAYVAANRLEFLDVALDRGGRCAAAYRVTAFPAAAVIDRKGIVRWRGHLTFFPAALLEKIGRERENP